MDFKKEMEDIISMMIREVEFERFTMGLGKVEFAKILGIHFHTYQSFIKKDRRVSTKTGSIIAQFLVERKANIDDLAERVEKLVKFEMDKLKE